MARKRVPAAEARAGMKDLVDAVKNRNERIKITRYGKTVAYLVPAQDGEALEKCADELDDCARKAELVAMKGGSRKVADKLDRVAARAVTTERLRKSLKAARDRLTSKSPSK
jgi:prevent-host-death family protein